MGSIPARGARELLLCRCVFLYTGCKADTVSFILIQQRHGGADMKINLLYFSLRDLVLQIVRVLFVFINKQTT